MFEARLAACDKANAVGPCSITNSRGGIVLLCTTTTTTTTVVVRTPSERKNQAVDVDGNSVRRIFFFNFILFFRGGTKSVAVRRFVFAPSEGSCM